MGSVAFVIIILLLKAISSFSLLRYFDHWLIPLLYALFGLGFSLTVLLYSVYTDYSRWEMPTILGLSRALMIAFLVSDILICVFTIFNWIFVLVGLIFKEMLSDQSSVFSLSRRHFIRNFGIYLSALPFFGTIYGIFRGKYHFKVRKADLEFENLPSSFNGYRIIQFSDFHAGSFDNPARVKKGLKMIQDLKPDLLVFTGDMVNIYADEVKPYIEDLSELQAKDKKIAILGNHDYYGQLYRNAEGDVDKLCSYMDDMGFKVLRNQTYQLEKDGEQIDIIGVENWGRGPFPKFGDLEKALEASNNNFRILLSHDPSHWEEEVISNDTLIDLTLCGHTHGFQFGIELPFLKWSPIQYTYKRWAGLYQQNKRRLYINRGFGYLWFSGRIGIWPEITEITLVKKEL